MPTLTFDQISKEYQGIYAVQRLTLHVADGEFVSLLGPSGCGKTTTLRMVAGFIKPDSGTLVVGERVLADARKGIFVPPEQRGMGMVFQSYAVWPHMTTFDNVAYPLRLQRRPRVEIRQRVADVLKLVALDGYERRYPHQLSGGQQQRVALARALVANPVILLLDEPLSNLDARLRDSTRYEIVALHKRLGITVLYVTHDQAEAMAMSDRIVVMNKGEVLQVGTPQEVYRAPQHKFVAEFVGSANFFAADVTSAQAGSAQVRLEDGSVLVVTLETPVSGGRGWLMVRPEHVRLAGDDAHLRGRVVRRTYLGDRWEIEIIAGEHRVRALLTETAGLPDAQAEVGLTFSQAAYVPMH